MDNVKVLYDESVSLATEIVREMKELKDYTHQDMTDYNSSDYILAKERIMLLRGLLSDLCRVSTLANRATQTTTEQMIPSVEL